MKEYKNQTHDTYFDLGGAGSVIEKELLLVLLLLLLLSLTCCLSRLLLAEEATYNLVVLRGCLGVVNLRVLKHPEFDFELFVDRRDGLRVWNDDEDCVDTAAITTTAVTVLQIDTKISSAGYSVWLCVWGWPPLYKPLL